MNFISYKTYRQMLLIGIVLILGCESSVQKVSDIKPDVTTLVEHLYGGTGGISVDSAGNIYSSDFGPTLGQITPNFQVVSNVFKMTPDGQVSIFADSLFGASGSEFDAQGNFFQSNIRGAFISRIEPNGQRSKYASDSIVAPVGLAFADNGDLIICNCGNNTLRRVTTLGENYLFSQGEIFKCPNGITKDERGNFYTANFYDGNVIKINPEGQPSIFATIPGNNNGHLVYKDDFLYVVARAAHQIYKVSMEGEVELFAGSGNRGRRNGSRMEASFSYPNDLDFSPDGNYLYVNEIADTLSSHRILTPTSVRRIKMP